MRVCVCSRSRLDDVCREGGAPPATASAQEHTRSHRFCTFADGPQVVLEFASATAAAAAAAAGVLLAGCCAAAAADTETRLPRTGVAARQVERALRMLQVAGVQCCHQCRCLGLLQQRTLLP
jgi:hypothetical protein